MSEEEIKVIKDDIAQLKQDVALLNQFNREVAKPYLDNMARKLASLDVVTRNEFEAYKDSAKEDFVDKVTFAELKTRVNTALWVGGIIGTVVIGWIVNSVLKLIS